MVHCSKFMGPNWEGIAFTIGFISSTNSSINIILLIFYIFIISFWNLYVLKIIRLLISTYIYLNENHNLNFSINFYWFLGNFISWTPIPLISQSFHICLPFTTAACPPKEKKRHISLFSLSWFSITSLFSLVAFKAALCHFVQFSNENELLIWFKDS